MLTRAQKNSYIIKWLEDQKDYSKSRKTLILACILIPSLGIVIGHTVRIVNSWCSDPSVADHLHQNYCALMGGMLKVAQFCLFGFTGRLNNTPNGSTLTVSEPEAVRNSLFNAQSCRNYHKKYDELYLDVITLIRYSGEQLLIVFGGSAGDALYAILMISLGMFSWFILFHFMQLIIEIIQFFKNRIDARTIRSINARYSVNGANETVVSNETVASNEPVVSNENVLNIAIPPTTHISTLQNSFPNQVFRSAHDATYCVDNLQRTPTSKTKKLIMKTLNNRNQIISETIDLSMLCPISKRRMITPVRFNSCSHVSCVDFSSLIKVSQSQGYNPNKTSIFNAKVSSKVLFGSLNRLIIIGNISHEGPKEYLKALESSNRRTPDTTKLCTLNVSTSSSRSRIAGTSANSTKLNPYFGNVSRKASNWISRAKYSVAPGIFEKVANVLICPICNNNLLFLQELEICEFTEKLLQKVDNNEDAVTISLVNRQIQVRDKTGEIIVMDSSQRVIPERVNMKRTRSEVKTLESTREKTKKKV